MSKLTDILSSTGKAVLRPLCWIKWHPFRAKTDMEKYGTRTRCISCGQLVRGANAILLALIVTVGSLSASPAIAQPPDDSEECVSFWWPFYEYDEWCRLMLAHEYRTHPFPFFRNLWLDQWYGDGTEPGDGYYRSYARFPIEDPPPVPCEGCD